MPHPPTRLAAPAAPAALAAALLLLTTACGTSDQDGATDPGTDPAGTDPAVDELAAQDGRPCPGRLPGGDDVGGTDPASSAPDLAAPDRAWVCTYVLRSGPAAGPDGAAWTRQTRPQPVAPDLLPGLAATLAELAPADDGRLCTEELGPRHLIVLADDGAGTDLTGVVVDGYGCRDVRLTDDPSTTPPGEASTPGVVPGVLTAPDDLLETLTSGGLVAGR